MSCNNLFDEEEKEELEQAAQEDTSEPAKVFKAAMKEKKTAQKRRRQMMEKIRVNWATFKLNYRRFICKSNSNIEILAKATWE